MKWTVKLLAEIHSAESVEHEVATIERADVASPATLGLTIVAGKAILESRAGTDGCGTDSTSRHPHSRVSGCGRTFRTKSYHHYILRSVYGNVLMRVRRIKGRFALRIARAEFLDAFHKWGT